MLFRLGDMCFSPINGLLSFHIVGYIQFSKLCGGKSCVSQLLFRIKLVFSAENLRTNPLGF